MDIIKYAIDKKLKIPDAVIFVFPIPNLINHVYSQDPFTFLRLEENCIYTKIRENFIDLENKELSEFNDDHRLNFFLTNPEIIKAFPKVFILSAANEPLKENSLKLFEYFRYDLIFI
jgi:hypothetical protein